MLLNRWNYKLRIYEPYVIPDHWKVSTYEDDMSTQVNCAACGKKIPFGDGYTSNAIHTKTFGFGYAVCESCHQEEMTLRFKFYGRV